MNIVYGGAFNPPSIAHYEIAEFLKSLPCDNVILLPVGIKYQKNSLINNQYRLDMIKIMAKKLNCLVCDYEMYDEQYLGTYHTLNRLSTDFDDLYFVMGADNVVSLDKWINYELFT